MLQKLKKWIKPFFTLSKSEQRGIVLFSFLILLVLVFRLILPFLDQEKVNTDSKFFKEMEAFYQAQQYLSDSLRIDRLQNSGELDTEMALKKLKPFAFNPNNLPEEQWIQMGFTPKQAKSIKNYEAKGGKFRSKDDVKKMYAISDIEYEILEPYILLAEAEIPEKIITQRAESNITSNKSYPAKKTPQNVEINSADSMALVDQLLLPPWLAERVVKYRELLGGYYSTEQLGEVYGFKNYYLTKVAPYVQIDTLLINQIDLNHASFKDILKHPYISYDMTKEIVNFRDKKSKYQTVSDLQQLDIIPDTIFVKLRPYIIIND